MSQRPPVFLLLALALCALGPAVAAGTPAGAEIVNRALGDALSDDGVTPLQATSNEVRSVVQAVCAPVVTPDGTPAAPGQQARIRSGGAATFAYRVLNAGNAPFILALAAEVRPGGSAALGAGDLAVHRDADGDGRPDGAPITSLGLAPDGAADVLLVVSAPAAVWGSAQVSLGAACASGERDAPNVAAVTIDPVSRVVLEKTFGAASARPGERVPVTLRLTNTGNGPADNLEVADALNTPALAGLSLVPGSARAGAGTLAYSDGQAWTPAEGAAVTALRWRVPRLEAGARAALSFEVAVAIGAAPGGRTNVATLAGPDGEQAASAGLNVGAAPALALGPQGRPEAPELGPDDRQERRGVAAGQQVCFAQTVANTGNLADRITLGAAVEGGPAEVTFLAMGGAPLAQPVALAPGGALDFQACVSARADAAVRLSARSSVGAADNATVDVLGGVDARPVALVKTVTPAGTVTRGAALTYTLSATNPYAWPLTGVVLRDELPAALELTAAEGAQVRGQSVAWTIATLAPGETARRTVQARVRAETLDGTVLSNTFTLESDQTPDPLTSAPAHSPVWTAALLIDKAVSAPTAQPGDRLTYRVRVRNGSPAAELRELRVRDVLPAGLVYLPGSATLNGAPLADPLQGGDAMVWTLAAPLAPGAEARLTYDVRVTGAAGELTNVVSATAQGGGGEVRAVLSSNVARAAVRVRPLAAGQGGLILGRVYVDRNRNGVFEPALDTPLERARVLLADGRQALTDAAGRYHFAPVPGPTAALRLDPNSVPYRALSVPADGGRPGSRLVVLTGLTTVDFPLAALAADVAATRATTVRGGPLTLTKTVTRGADGLYTARLVLVAGGEVLDLDLTDPLPVGAVLREGTPGLRLPTLGAGERTLTYRYALPAGAEPMTDPTLTWRLP